MPVDWLPDGCLSNHWSGAGVDSARSVIAMTLAARVSTKRRRVQEIRHRDQRTHSDEHGMSCQPTSSRVFALIRSTAVVATGVLASSGMASAQAAFEELHSF